MQLEKQDIVSFENAIVESFSFCKPDVINKIGGFSADNYSLKIEDKSFLLKVYKDKPLSEIEKIEAITSALSDQDIPVAVPLLTHKGGHHFAVQDRNAELYPWIEGEVLHETSFTSPTLCAAAEALSFFHKCLMPDDVNLDNAQTLVSNMSQFQKDCEEIGQLIEAESHGKETDDLTLRLMALKKELLEKSIKHDNFADFFSANDLVHGDFHNENLLFGSDGKVVAIFDFEAVHSGHRMQDVINFIMFACCNTGFENKNIDLAKSFLSSYKDFYPFTVQELHFGVHYALFRLASSVFLEKLLYTTRDTFFAQLLERDLKKLGYFQKNMKHFISALEG